MTDGICPFAQNLTHLAKNTSDDHYVDRIGFVDHTAGGWKSTMDRPGFWDSVQASTHFAIGQDGSISQYVNIFRNAWAQGIVNHVTYPLYDSFMKRRNPNGYFISTEHEDGAVTNYVWSEAMYQADLRLKRWCIEEVRRVKGVDIMRFGRDSLAGHYMFRIPERRYCPGDNWPRDRLLQDLLAPPEPTPTPGDNDMITHDVWASQGIWSGGASHPVRIDPGGSLQLWATYDFNLPEGTTRARIEFALFSGYIEVMHKRNSKSQAGRCGWGVPIGQPSYSVVEVDLDSEGWCQIDAPDKSNPPTFAFAHCIGYI